MISIRRQLTRRLLGTTLGLLAVGLAALLALACYALMRQFDGALRTKALAISTVVVVNGDEVRVEFTDRFLHGFDDENPRDFFQLWRSDGSTIARSESLGRGELVHQVGAFDAPRYFLCRLPTGRPGRAIGFSFRPKQPRGAKPVDLELVVATDREDLDETLLQLAGLAAGCGLLLLGTTLWVVPRVLRRGLQPLDRLGAQAVKIDAASLSARFPVDDLPEELQPIALRLNDLLARLQESFARERRFSADLAHELRTPIAELRSLAECALKWPEARDPAADQDILAIARHMESLTTSMLALTRGETGQLAGQLEPVYFSALIADTWQPFAARAAARGLHVNPVLPPTVVSADPALLRSVLSNLFDNAVDYATEGGEIDLLVQCRDREVVFQIANSTSNLETADMARLFDPFWRKEAARSGGRHFGLGLPLARTFATAMGWTLTARLDQQKRVVLRLAGPSLPQEEIFPSQKSSPLAPGLAPTPATSSHLT